MNTRKSVIAAIVGTAAVTLAIPAWALFYGGTTNDRLDRIELNTCNLLLEHGTVPASCAPVVNSPPPQTTTTRPPTTTTNGSTTTIAPTTTASPTTMPPTTVGVTTTIAANPAACGIANAAFCETFDQPINTNAKTGDLDQTLWGVSRVGDVNPGQAIFNNIHDTSITGCGTSADTNPPNDVRICNGQMYEGLDDNHAVVNLDTYPKQPFDFAGRTGKVVFDVSADSMGTHAAWPEFVITNKPVPGVRGSISLQVPAGASDSVGFALDGSCGAPVDGNLTGVGLVFVTKTYVYSEPAFTTVGCVTKGSASAMNHFEVRISQNHMEVWGTDAGQTTLKQLAIADGIGLTLTRGLVWLNDVHYNARKALEPCECGPQFRHTFVWDNLGFDGPKTYRDYGFDTPDPNVDQGDTTQEGYFIGNGPVTLNTSAVSWLQTPTGAQVVLNTYAFDPIIPSISINGNPPIATPWPWSDGLNGFSWRSLSIPVPVSQVHTGVNTITFTSSSNTEVVANVTLIMVAAAPVP